MAGSSVIVFAAVLVVAVKAGPVMDRLDPHRRLQDVPCRIAYAGGMKELIPMFWKKIIVGEKQDSDGVSVRSSPLLNCNLREYNEKVTSKPAGNETHDWLAGVIENNEADLAIAFYRSDTFGDRAPGHVLTTGLPADSVILSRRPHLYVIRHSLFGKWMSKLDPSVVRVGIICMITLVIVFTITSTGKKKKVTIIRVIKKVVRSSERTFRAVTGQAATFQDRNSTANKILISSLLLLVVVLVYGTRIEVFKADLFNWFDEPVINSLEELFNQQESDGYPRPLLVTNFGLLHVLKKTRDPGSNLWPMKQEVEKDPPKTTLSLDFGSKKISHQLAVLLERVKDGESAAIMPEIVVDLSWDFLCTLYPRIAHRMMISESSFAQGQFVMLMSHKIDPLLRKVFEFIAGTAAATGQVLGLMRKGIDLRPITGRDNVVMGCPKQGGNQFWYHDHYIWDLSLHVFMPVFVSILKYSAAAAITVFACEILLSKLRGKTSTRTATVTPAIEVTEASDSMPDPLAPETHDGGGIAAHII